MVPSLEFPVVEVQAIEPVQPQPQSVLLSLESLNIGSQESMPTSPEQDAWSVPGTDSSRFGTCGSGRSNDSRSRSRRAMDRLQGGPLNNEATLAFSMQQDDASDIFLAPESSSTEVVAKLLNNDGKDNPVKPPMFNRRHSVPSVLTSGVSNVWEMPTRAHEGCSCSTFSVV